MGEARKVMRWDIINRIIKNREFTSYLEVGIQYGENYSKIKCKNKAGCDPATYYRDKNIELVASDKFFQSCRLNKRTFDIVFIDGLHEKEQFIRDVKNALEVLNKGGVIVCHDCKPIKQSEANYPRIGGSGRWNGTTYLGWIQLRTELDYLMYVLDTDEGIGIIEPDKIGMNLPQDMPLPTWEEYAKNKEMYLNLKEVE